MKTRHPILASDDDADYIVSRIRALPRLFEEFFETLADAYDLEQELRAKGIIVIMSTVSPDNQFASSSFAQSPTFDDSIDTADNPLSAFSKTNEEVLRRGKRSEKAAAALSLDMEHLVDEQQAWGTVLISSGSGSKSHLANLNCIASRVVQVDDGDRGVNSGTSSTDFRSSTTSTVDWRFAKETSNLGTGPVTVSASVNVDTEEDIIHLLLLRVQAAKLFTFIRDVTCELEEIPASTFRLNNGGNESSSSLQVNTALTQVLSKIVLLWNGETGIHLDERALSWAKPLTKLGQDAVNHLGNTQIKFSFGRKLKRDMTSPNAGIAHILKLLTTLSVLVTVVLSVVFTIVSPGAVVAVPVILLFGVISLTLCVLLIIAYSASLSALADILNKVWDADLTTSNMQNGSPFSDKAGDPLNKQIQRQRREARFNQEASVSATSSKGASSPHGDNAVLVPSGNGGTNIVHVSVGGGMKQRFDAGESYGADLPSAAVGIGGTAVGDSAFGSIHFENPMGVTVGGHPTEQNNAGASSQYQQQTGGLGGSVFGGSDTILSAPMGTGNTYFPLYYNIPGVGGLPPGVNRAYIDCRFVDAQLVMIGFDDRLNVVLWNAAAEAATGFLETEVLGKPVVELLEAPYPDFSTLVEDEETSATKIQLKAFATSSITMFAICAPVVVSRQQHQSYMQQQQQQSHNQPFSSRASAGRYNSQYNPQVSRANQHRLSGYPSSGDVFGSMQRSGVDASFYPDASSAGGDSYVVGHVLICAAGKDNLQDANHYMTNYYASQVALNLRRTIDEGSIQYRQDRQNLASLIDFASRGSSHYLLDSAKMLAYDWEWCTGPQLLSRALRHHLNKCEVIPLATSFPSTLCINAEAVCNCLERIVEFCPSPCTVSLEIRMDRGRNVSVIVGKVTIVPEERKAGEVLEVNIQSKHEESGDVIIVGGGGEDDSSAKLSATAVAVLPPTSILKKVTDPIDSTLPTVVLSSNSTLLPSSSEKDPTRKVVIIPATHDETTSASTSTKTGQLLKEPDLSMIDDGSSPLSIVASSSPPLRPSSKRREASGLSSQDIDALLNEATFDLDSMMLPGSLLPKALSKCFGMIVAKNYDSVVEFTAPCQLASYHMAAGNSGGGGNNERRRNGQMSTDDTTDSNDESGQFDDLESRGALGAGVTSALDAGNAGPDSLESANVLQQQSKITCTVHVMTLISNLVDQHNLSIVLLNTPFVALTSVRQISDLDTKIRSNEVDVVVADKSLYWQAKTLLQNRLDVFLVPLMPSNAPHDPLVPYMLRTPVNHNAVLSLMVDIGDQVQGRKRTQQERDDRERILASRQDSPWTQGKLLGRGACGVVYEAISDLTGGKMAVKMFYFKKSSDLDKEMTTMLQEIKIMCSLNHTNIVHYFYCERKNDNLNLFMELCDGSLTDYLNKQIQRINNTDLTALSTNTIVEQILRALVYLHDQGITHRDIKPQNILLKGNIVKMTDFGTARQNMEEELLDVQGTFRYMAPEVYRGQPHSQSCDIWSLGCLTAEIIGSPLSFMEPRNSSMLGEMTGVAMPASLRGEARDFVEQCLNMNPAARPRASMLLLHPFLTSQSEVQTLLSFAEAQARPGGKRDSIASRASAFSLSSVASKVSKASKGR